MLTARCATSPTDWSANGPSGQPAASALPVPFDTYHRDDQPDAVRAAIGDNTPAVVAETVAGIVPLLDSTELANCRGSIDALVEAIEQKLANNQLAWPTSR